MSNEFGYPHTGWCREEKVTPRGLLLTALHGGNPDVNACALIALVTAFFVGAYWTIEILCS